MTALAFHDAISSCRLSAAANLANRYRVARLAEIMPCHEFGLLPGIAFVNMTYRPEAIRTFAMKRYFSARHGSEES